MDERDHRLPDVSESLPVSDEVREELDRRLAAYYADPSSARRWAEIKEELFGTSNGVCERRFTRAALHMLPKAAQDL